MASVMSCSSLHAEIESHDLGFCMDIGNIGFFFANLGPRGNLLVFYKIY